MVRLGKLKEFKLEDLVVKESFFYLRSPIFVESSSKTLVQNIEFKHNKLELSTERVIMLHLGRMDPKVQSFATVSKVTSTQSEVPVLHIEEFVIDDRDASRVMRISDITVDESELILYSLLYFGPVVVDQEREIAESNDNDLLHSDEDEEHLSTVATSLETYPNFKIDFKRIEFTNIENKKQYLLDEGDIELESKAMNKIANR